MVFASQEFQKKTGKLRAICRRPETTTARADELDSCLEGWYGLSPSPVFTAEQQRPVSFSQLALFPQTQACKSCSTANRCRHSEQPKRVAELPLRGSCLCQCNVDKNCFIRSTLRRASGVLTPVQNARTWTDAPEFDRGSPALENTLNRDCIPDAGQCWDIAAGC